jgi:hypothetical protein
VNAVPLGNKSIFGRVLAHGTYPGAIFELNTVYLQGLKEINAGHFVPFA